MVEIAPVKAPVTNVSSQPKSNPTCKKKQFAKLNVFFFYLCSGECHCFMRFFFVNCDSYSNAALIQRQLQI